MADASRHSCAGTPPVEVVEKNCTSAWAGVAVSAKERSTVARPRPNIPLSGLPEPLVSVDTLVPKTTPKRANNPEKGDLGVNRDMPLSIEAA